METLSKGEFLSFLYAEKSRELENNSAPGWNLWAIGGIIISMILFIYNKIKYSDLDTNVILLYFVLYLSWLLMFVHLLFYYKRRRICSHVKLRRLINEVPILIYIIRGVLSIVGLCIAMIQQFEWYCSFLWGFACSINICIICYVCIYKNKVVKAGLKTNVFSKDKYDLYINLILIILYAIIYLSQSFYVENVDFKWNEFEIAISILLIIVGCCVLINLSQRNKIAEGIDYIIEAITGGFIDQKEAYKRYIYLIYGKDVLQVLEEDINNLPTIYDCISVREQLREILNRIQNKTLSVREISEIIEILRDRCDFQKRTLKRLNTLNKRCNEILSLNMPRVITSEFGEVVVNIKRLMQLLEEILIKCKEVISAFKNLCGHVNCEKTESIFGNLYCIYISNPIKWKYKLKLWLYNLYINHKVYGLWCGKDRYKEK